MFDPSHDRKLASEPVQQSAQKEAHKLEAYLDAFRPVLTETEIAVLEDRIDRLRQA
jgi:hypothetical protein